MNDVEVQKKKDQDLFEADIHAVGSKLPEHKLKEFTFNALERQMLAEQQTIVALAQETQDKVINELCLKRLNIIPDPSIRVRYSIGLGRLAVFLPRKTTH